MVAATASLDHFYVWLASNANLPEFPTNRANNFRNRLARPIELGDEDEFQNWEVALMDISYPNNYPRWQSYSASFRLEVVKRDASSSSTPFTVQTSDEFMITIPASKPSITNVLQQFNARFMAFRLSDKIKFEINAQTETVRFTCKNIEANLIAHSRSSVRLLRDIGYTYLNARDEEQTLVENSIAGYTPQFFPSISTIFIYTDIIQYQFIGNTKAPLLETLPTHSKLTIVWEDVEIPTYCPISQSYINEIGISIRDDLGELISFDIGKIILKLHFRRRRRHN